MAGEIGHRGRTSQPLPLEVLLDTGAGGGSYFSASLWRSLIKAKIIPSKLDTNDAGTLHAANPSKNNVPPMSILGSTVIPILFATDNCVRRVVIRVVEDLPYGFILRTEFFRTN